MIFLKGSYTDFTLTLPFPLLDLDYHKLSFFKFLFRLLGRLSLGYDLPTSNGKIFLCQSIHLYQFSIYYSSASILCTVF